jgi:hypothetical protein
MAATFADLKKQDREYDNFQEDNAALAQRTAKPVTAMVGGMVDTGVIAYSNGDAATMQFTTDGRLMTDTTVTTGDINVDNTSLSTNGLVGKAAALNADFSTAYASATTIDCTGFPTIIGGGFSADDVVSIQQIATDGSVTNTYTRDDITLTAAGAAIVTLTVAGAAFIATDTFIVYLSVRAVDIGAGNVDTLTPRVTLATDDAGVAFLSTIDTSLLTVSGAVALDDSSLAPFPSILLSGGEYRASATEYADGDAAILQTDINGNLKVRTNGYDSGTDSNKVFEVNPISDHHVEETLVENATEADGTNYYYVDMDGYKNFSAQIEVIPGSGSMTVTLEATNQDDGTVAASCTYQDVTTALTGVASTIVDDFWIVNTPTAFKYLRYKTVSATGAADDAGITIYHKKMY